jgi:NADPH:quinone reductase-like Zn-dependent oxidoreductase
MRALYASSIGGDAPLANLAFGERPEPVPAPGEVRIRMRAATLNHHDYWTLKGVVGYPITPPRILGCDGAGVVDSYGAQRPDWAPEVGTQVAVYPVRFCGKCRACQGGADPMLCRKFEMLSDGDFEGSFAEFVTVPAQNAIPKPAHLTMEETAALGVSYLTAYRMLFTKAALRPGHSVLVQGAGGGLATAAIALAAAAGVTVIASSRSEAKLAAAKKLGAAHAVQAGRDAAKSIIGLTGSDGVDAVIESVGEPTWQTSLRAVRSGGSVVVAGATGGANPGADLSRIFWRQIRILGSTMGSLDEFGALLRFVESARIKPLIEKVYPMSDYLEAFQRLASGEHTGKLALSIP